MKTYFLLLSPRFRSWRNRLQRGEEGSLVRILAMGLVTLGFWVGIFVGFYKVLGYFQAAEGFGNILARKLMGMLWLTFFAVLLFSNVITALSTWFLSKDLETIHSSPISTENLFWARLTDTLIDSSWMVFFFGLPVFLAYGIVFKAGALYYLELAGVAIPFLVLTTSLAVIFTIGLVNVFPARRTRDILVLLGIMLLIALYLMFRFMRPERLVNPDTFATVVSYLASMETPTSPYLPSQWATEILWSRLARGGLGDGMFYLLILWSTSAASAVVGSWVAGAIYPSGFSKAQEGARRIVPGFNPLDALAWLISRPFHPSSQVLITKEIKIFFRDNTQWTQLLLLSALIVIYLYNFSVLDLQRYPLRVFYLQNAISFLNIGLAAFVVASLAVRFVFPAVSQEGFAWWIIRSSPITLKRFLWTKYCLYAPPLLLVAEILIVFSNYLLDVTPFMMVLSAGTIFFLVAGIISLGIGLGAAYPRFETENIAAVATGFGGMIFMILCALYTAGVVILEAWPVLVILRSLLENRPIQDWQKVLMAVCFSGVIALNVLAFILPMNLGLRRLLERENR